ncbi:MAG: metallophosphoesterase [Lachnospiraceae bacterium]|nr:metallophosphoesterase [Lachnospiraceae bacterium]
MFIFNKPPVITEYVIESHKLGKDERNVFAVISDLHECRFGRDNGFLIEALNEIRPDALIIAGDLINAYAEGDPYFTMETLNTLHKQYPLIFFAPGNHESKILKRPVFKKQMLCFQREMEKAGLSLLRNGYRDAFNGLRIYGLELDHEFYRRFVIKRLPEKMLEELLGRAEGERFNILIAHDPAHFPDYIKWKPDLILSGHVHGGLIRIPGIGGLIGPAYTPFPKYDSGLYEKDGVKMIVSRGAGSHTINLRINNPPEILKLVIKGI